VATTGDWGVIRRNGATELGSSPLSKEHKKKNGALPRAEHVEFVLETLAQQTKLNHYGDSPPRRILERDNLVQRTVGGSHISSREVRGFAEIGLACT
jgi:hypothetical protein